MQVRFMFNRKSRSFNPQGDRGPKSDDELISDYLDGQLAPEQRVAFDARLSAEPALARQVQATRALVRAARELPAVPVPRNFTLPKSMAAPAAAPRRAPSPIWWRLGSALAAAVFVFAVGLDVSGVLHNVPSAAPAMAPAQTSLVAQNAAPQVAQPGGEAAAATAAPEAARVAEETAADAATVQPTPPAETPSARMAFAPTATAEPSAKMQPVTPVTEAQSLAAGAALAPEATPTGPEVQPPVPLSDSVVVTQGYNANEPRTLGAGPEPAGTAAPTSVLVQPEATAPVAAPAPEQTAPPAATNPVAETVARVVAALAFVLAVAFGILGWARR
jgi:hypothetical protein